MMAPTLPEKEASVSWLALPAETKKIYKDVKRLLMKKLRPRSLSLFAEFQARKLRPGETALLSVHELKHLLAVAMPSLDADSQNRILFQQLLAGSPTTAVAR